MWILGRTSLTSERTPEHSTRTNLRSGRTTPTPTSRPFGSATATITTMCCAEARRRQQ